MTKFMLENCRSLSTLHSRQAVQEYMFAWDADVGLQVNSNLTAALDVAPGRIHFQQPLARLLKMMKRSGAAVHEK